MNPQTIEITQADLDYRDLRIGRLTLNLESILEQGRRLQAQLQQAQAELKQRDERIKELEGIVADLADDDEDDEETDEETDEEELDPQLANRL